MFAKIHQTWRNSTNSQNQTTLKITQISNLQKNEEIHEGE